MEAAFSYLAQRRWAAVGLALAVEVAALVPLAIAEPSAVIGVPAAITTAIGGTVAVVVGPLDGVAVSLLGAAVFGSVGGWRVDELVALAVWPGVVALAGVFARRMEGERRALARLVGTREEERRRLALELHDQTAQALAAALISLRRAERSVSPAELGEASSATRELIHETIERVREIAVELRPKALDDFGLPPALERLAARFSARTGIAAEVDAPTQDGRLPRETEVAVYRAAEDVLGHIETLGSDGVVRIALEQPNGDVRLAIVHRPVDGERRASAIEPPGLRERVRLAGGRVAARSTKDDARIRIELPV